MCNGLCKPEFAPGHLDVVAMLPTYDETKHPHCTKEQHALNRHVLVWSALGHMLRPWTNLSPEEDDASSWLFAGAHVLGGADAPCDVYVVPFMWLAGVCVCVCVCVRRICLLLSFLFDVVERMRCFVVFTRQSFRRYMVHVI